MASSISFGGLASGLDTNLIIDKLVEIEGTRVTKLKTRQTGVKSQISTLGDIVSRLSALETAAKELATGGVLGLKTTSTNTAFGAVAGGGAAAGSYRIAVTELAQAAKARSGPFGAADLVAAGTLDFTVQGKTYSVDVGDKAAGTPASLEDVAAALRAKAPVSAVVLNDGANRYLSVTSLATGSPLDGGTALALTHNATGATGKPLAEVSLDTGKRDLTITQTARNAQFTIDDLPFTRTSNVVTDALPGTTLTLKVKGGPAEDLVLANDVEATKTKLQPFVDAYNTVLRSIQTELQTTATTDRSKTLTGDSTLRYLQQRLQALVAAKVTETGTVRTLADLGLKSGSGGALTVDPAALASAMERDPAAVNTLFSTATKGLAALTSAEVQAFTRSGDGLLTTRKESLDGSVKRMDGEIERLQARLDAYRVSLVKRFTAMEEAVSKMKASGNYLSSHWTMSNKD
jgi:flagellar hook-associated protein 2